jgi:hypothetical protein
MQLVSCPNSSEINRNHQNDVLTVATGIVDSISVRYYCDNSSKGIACIGNVHCYCAFAGLVAPRSPKLGLSYLKIETRGTVLNLVTRPCAHMQSDRGGCGGSAHIRSATTRVVGKAVRACEQC